MSGIHRLRKIIRHTGLHHELAHRPPGKRSVAVAKKGDPSNAVTGPVVPPVCGREKSFTRKPDKVSPHLKPPEHPRAGCSNSLQRDVHIGYGKIIGYIRPLGYFGDGCSLGRVAEMMTLLDMRKQYHHRLYTVQGWLHCWPVIFPEPASCPFGDPGKPSKFVPLLMNCAHP